MNKVIVFELKNEEGLHINYPLAASLEQCVDRLKAEHGEKVKRMSILDQKCIPQDRGWRTHWKLSEDGSEIIPDLAKCIDESVQRIREVRLEKLKDLDFHSMRAIEEDDKQRLNEIVQEKQRLRDLPQSLMLSECDSLQALEDMTDEIIAKLR